MELRELDDRAEIIAERDHFKERLREAHEESLALHLEIERLRAENARLRESVEGVLATPELQARIDAALAMPNSERRKKGVPQIDCADVIILMVKILKGEEE